MNQLELERIIAGDRRSLAKAITLIESRLEKDRIKAQEILEAILPYTGKSIRIGVTGAPGVGKSTFIESFGLHLINQKKKIAVLAVDPSSPIHGGSLLGDKTRMPELLASELAFIRPSPSGGALGGVAQKTRETMLLCEAAGYEIIIIETVGVGQSEVEVASMVDFFLVLMLPNAGDDLQGIKKGILELADAIAINKSDGATKEIAQVTRQHYQNAVDLLCKDSFWQTQVLECSAIENMNIDKIWQLVNNYHSMAIKHDRFQEKRSLQNMNWMKKLVYEMMELTLKQNGEIKKRWECLEKMVINNETTPFLAAKEIIDLYHTKE